MTRQPKSRSHTVGDLALLRQPRTRTPLRARPEPVEEAFTRFFDRSRDLQCVAGLDGYLKRLNPAWTATLGWTQEQLRARPVLDFVHPDDRHATRSKAAAIARNGATTGFENRCRHRGGSYRWLRWNARRIPGSRRIYAAGRDVTRQKQLEREILEIADREKERLAQELHDGLCQTLAGIAALSTTLARRMAAASADDASAAAAEITALLNDAIGEARDMAHGLGSKCLSEAGLDGALEALALNVGHLFRVSCTFRCDRRPLPPIPSRAEAHLYRIAQEAVNNAVTHGRARRIEVGLLACPPRDGGHGVLSVRDDGVGLPEEPTDHDGIGLQTMACRAQVIGASLEVRRRARGGTAVLCRFPLPAPPER